MKVLRGHTLQAVSHATVGAVALASIQGKADAEARVLIDDAIGNLLQAVIISMESIDISPDEHERQRVYQAALNYVGEPRG